MRPAPQFRFAHMRLMRPPAKVRGQALLILIVMISVAAMLLVYGSTTEVGRTVKADNKTRVALEYARQALIGRAIGDANRPGSLPCPDGNDDGSADLFIGSACPAYVGRLPWRTLGIGDLRDASGERLWYALSPNFRDHPSAPPINSDARGTLTIYSGTDSITVTPEAVAVIFAPGSAMPGQSRNSSPAQCASTGKHIPASQCASNYLDAAANVRNDAASGPYVIASPGPSFNDRIAVIGTPDFMPLVERRVALEVRGALLAYRAGSKCECYPWADGGNTGASEVGTNRGRIPVSSAAPERWAGGILPAYFAANQWAQVIYYAVGRSALENRGRTCATCIDESLSVDGADGYDVVLLTTGYAAPGPRRESWADYIDDAENRNTHDRYTTPQSQAAGRDRLYAISTRPR